MKKIIFLFPMLLLLSCFAKAQNTKTQSKSNIEVSSPQFGIKGGVNIANMHVENNTDYESRTGFYVGALAHIHIAEHFAVQPEVMYSTQGSELGTIKGKYDYINVPVLLQYMTHNGFRLQTGPQVGFLVSAKNKSGDLEVDVKDQLNTVDFAWSFGASYLSKVGLGLDARYNLGLTDILDDDANPEAKHRVWQIGVFYQFQK